jgi:DNA-binding MarR family transcriptional regulator
MIDKLELDGLVARERDKADGRIVRIVLSQKGIDKFSSHVEQSTEMLKIVLQDFSERDKEVVMRFITSYVRLVESRSSCH